MATITPLNSSSIYDEKIVRELFEQHYTPLVLFAKGYIPDLDTDKDVVQEVFLSLIESQETFNDVDNLKAYLYGTVKHKCLKYLRHGPGLRPVHLPRGGRRPPAGAGVKSFPQPVKNSVENIL